MKTEKEKLMRKYAREILKADSKDYDGSTDDICDMARDLSKLILKRE